MFRVFFCRGVFHNVQLGRNITENMMIRVPTHTGKPGKMREVFPVREKSGNFRISQESQGKVREFSISQGKVREN